MGWQEQLPWVTRPLGELPDTMKEHGLVLWYALRDLPRTIRQDATVEMAAGMTFFLLFSLFPGLVFLVTLLPYLPIEAPIDKMFEVARPLLPPEVYDLLYGHVEELITNPKTGLLTAAAAIALFSASRALVSLSRSLNRSYRVPKITSEAFRRLRSMGLTVCALLGAFFVQQLYYLLPDIRPRWRAISTGSMCAVIGWVGATWAFTTFATKFVKFNVTYGSLSSFAVIMAWMFLGSFALMAGGTINALVDRGLPPTPGEKLEPLPDVEELENATETLG